MAYLSQLGRPQYDTPTAPLSILLDPFALAAWRTRQSVRPTEGRQERVPYVARPLDPAALATKALEPITSYPGTYRDMNREGRVQMAEGIDQLSSPQNAWDLAKGAGNLSLGTLNWLGSPFSAALRTVAGKPIEENTGIPKEYTELALSMAPLMPKRGLPISGSRPVATPRSATRETLEGEVVPMYDPPAQPKRPFAADYPDGAKADEAGRLLHDMEGRPLVAKRVVGRRSVGGDDQPLPRTEFDALATDLTGKPATWVSAEDMRSWGRVVPDPDTHRPAAIYVRKELRPDQARMVYGHELGHAVEDYIDLIPTDGLWSELKRIYNTLNNPKRSRDESKAASGKPFTPKDLNYSKWHIPREYMAEAIRAYLADPNYIKSVAPQTARRIREFVNEHPELSKIIQFNSIAAVPVGVAVTNDAAEARGAEPND